jgi:hypothetical protein
MAGAAELMAGRLEECLHRWFACDIVSSPHAVLLYFYF